ncbi:MAG: hypothetical protein ACYS22_02355 [Planctomycetota bacterium]|jgi:hypothetical protein
MSSTREVIHPLFIPKGSVRALVTLVLVGATCLALIKGAVVNAPLNTALFLVVAYYFAHRSACKGVAAEAESEGRNPLFMPRGVIRVLIFGGFIATAVVLWRQGNLLRDSNVMTLVTMGSFFVGLLLNGLYEFRRRNPNVKTPILDMFGHIRAVAVLGAAVHLGLADTLGWEVFQTQHAHTAALGFIAFYFGSR